MNPMLRDHAVAAATKGGLQQEHGAERTICKDRATNGDSAYGGAGGAVLEEGGGYSSSSTLPGILPASRALSRTSLRWR